MALTCGAVGLKIVLDSEDCKTARTLQIKTDHTREKTRTPSGFHRAGFINSGDVLLSRNLEMHYHWGCSVSLPCSEWERVGPLRYDHQKAGEAEASPWGEGGGLSSTSPEILATDFRCTPRNQRLELNQSLVSVVSLKEQGVL
jgi:hypothetical protein